MEDRLLTGLVNTTSWEWAHCLLLLGSGWKINSLLGPTDGQYQAEECLLLEGGREGCVCVRVSVSTHLAS